MLAFTCIFNIKTKQFNHPTTQASLCHPFIAPPRSCWSPAHLNITCSSQRNSRSPPPIQPQNSLVSSFAHPFPTNIIGPQVLSPGRALCDVAFLIASEIEFSCKIRSGTAVLMTGCPLLGGLWFLLSLDSLEVANGELDCLSGVAAGFLKLRENNRQRGRRGKWLYMPFSSSARGV